MRWLCFNHFENNALPLFCKQSVNFDLTTCEVMSWSRRCTDFPSVFSDIPLFVACCPEKKSNLIIFSKFYAYYCITSPHGLLLSFSWELR